MKHSDTVILVAPALFDGKTVFTGEEQALVLHDSQITAVGSAWRILQDYPQVRTIRFENGMIAPGLIDTHTHLTLLGDGSTYDGALALPGEDTLAVVETNLRTHLEAGVTTVRDLGSSSEFLDWTPNRRRFLPRVLRAGRPLTSVGGHMSFFGGECSTLDDAVRIVEENIDRGADCIKIASSGGGTRGTVPHNIHVGRPLVERIVETAHDRGVQVTAHALSQRSMEEAILSGVDGIEHLGFLDDESGESSFVERIAELSRDRGVYFGSTLGINERLTRMSQPSDAQARQEQEVRSRYYLENARRLREAGGLLAVASDAGWNYTYFGDFAHEMFLMTQAGYSALEVLRMATSGNAKYLCMDDRVGSLRAGLCADVTVFKGRPDENIKAVKEVLAVFREGERAYFTPFR